MEKQLNNKKYIVLASAIGVNLLAGLLYVWSVLSKSLVEDLNWTSSQASLPYTAYTISFVLAMVIFGKAQDTKGPRIVATIGCILLGSGLILSGLFIEPKIMVLTMGMTTGSGAGMITVATSPAVVKWFPPEKKGMVTGLVVAGAGLASVFYSPLANHLIARIGIEKTFINIGIGVLIISVIIAQGLTNPPKVVKDEKTDEQEDETNKIDFTWREMLQSLNFYKIWLMLAFSSSAGLMITSHIANIVDIQVNWEAGYILVMLIAIFNTSGRILGGVVSDKIGRINLIKLIFTLQAINMLLFLTYTNKASLIIGVAVTGLCYGAGFSVFPALISDLYGPRNFGINYGLMFTGWALGGIIGPMLAATIYDRSNNYNLAYIVAFGLLVISIIIARGFKVRQGLDVERFSL